MRKLTPRTSVATMLLLVSIAASACGSGPTSVATRRRGRAAASTTVNRATAEPAVPPSGSGVIVPLPGNAPTTSDGGGTSYVLPPLVLPGDTHDYGGFLPPSSSSVGLDVVIEAAYNAGFRSESRLVTVTALAIEESALDPMARHYHLEYGPGQYDRGLWQISTHWFPQYTDAECDDPAKAARIVYTLSGGGGNFAPWDAYNSGLAQAHYDQSLRGWPAVRPLVKRFLAQRS